MKSSTLPKYLNQEHKSPTTNPISGGYTQTIPSLWKISPLYTNTSPVNTSPTEPLHKKARRFRTRSTQSQISPRVRTSRCQKCWEETKDKFPRKQLKRWLLTPKYLRPWNGKRKTDGTNCPRTLRRVWRPAVLDWPGRTLVAQRPGPQASR